MSATPDTAGEEGKVEDLFVFNDTIYNFIGTCNKQSPYAYSSSTHRFPDERTPIEATPLSATSAELGLGLGLGLGWLSCLGLNFLLRKKREIAWRKVHKQ